MACNCHPDIRTMADVRARNDDHARDYWESFGEIDDETRANLHTAFNADN